MKRKIVSTTLMVLALFLADGATPRRRENLWAHENASAAVARAELTKADAEQRTAKNPPSEAASGLSQFLPHGVCLLWDQSLLLLHVVSDALIALAYYSIPVALIFFVRKRKDLAFSWIFVLFAIFIPEPVRLSKIVGEVRDILRAIAVKKQIAIKLEVDRAVEDLIIDPARLKQVLYNYLSNALKFTPSSGRVIVRAQPDGADHFRIEVEDNGIGIQPADFGRLFVEFQQLDASSAKKFPGTGLGLALTKRIVEAQAGRVGVQSTHGQGSMFFAVLPRACQHIGEIGETNARVAAWAASTASREL